MDATAAAEDGIRQLLDTGADLGLILQYYNEYAKVSVDQILADFAHSGERQAALWQLYQKGKAFFSKHVKDMRARGPSYATQARTLTKFYLTFLKAAELNYRNYIHQLNAASGGIPELGAVAHKIKPSCEIESATPLAAPELRDKVLKSCHITLLRIGDLCRYRAVEKLDANPNFGPAIGYYELADTLRPSSGMGHHQQAIVFLRQDNRVRAIYELYRAIVVDEPHPSAEMNLNTEFTRIYTAFKKGELIPKATPNDPEAPKRILMAWFILLHSHFVKGTDFSSRIELENEVLITLGRLVHQEAAHMETALTRTVLVNMAAQYRATVLFQDVAAAGGDAGRHQQAFMYLFAFNIKTFTVLLREFYRDLPAKEDVVPDDDLTNRLTPTMRRLLPSLRMYSSWLAANVHLLTGLKDDDFLSEVITDFWTCYAKVLHVLSDDEVFGVWALDDYEPIYMLVEDVQTLGFKPLQNEHQTNWKAWFSGSTLKPRFSDEGVESMAEDEEMLVRMKGLLDDGSKLANNRAGVPLVIVGDRVTHVDDAALVSALYQTRRMAAQKAIEEAAKPLSYAAAAATPQKKSIQTPKNTAAILQDSQTETTHMADSMVSDESFEEPVTPPNQIWPRNGNNGNDVRAKKQRGATGGRNGTAKVSNYQPNLANWRAAPAVQPAPALAPQEIAVASTTERLKSVAGLWSNDAAPMESSGFPAGLPTGTLSSPQHIMRHGHTRGNSATSMRSTRSGFSMDSPQQQVHVNNTNAMTDGYARFSEAHGSSAMLFGTGRPGIWSYGDGQGAFRRPSG